MKTLNAYYRNIKTAIKSTHRAQKMARAEIMPLMPEYSKAFKF